MLSPNVLAYYLAKRETQIKTNAFNSVIARVLLQL
jgi:hypothetical protein